MAPHIAWVGHALVTLVTGVLAFLVPSFYSYKALEAQQHTETWLTYWLVIGVFTTLEHCLFFLVHRVPFWALVKLAFVVWLQLPQTQGAKVLYMKFILPALKQHEVVIDRYVEMGESKFKKSLAHLGITSHQASQPPTSFPSPGRLESLTQTTNRFSTSSGGVAASPDIEARGNATKAS